MSSKTKTTATEKDGKTALVPKLRFPEFRDEPAWEETILSSVLTEHGETNDGASEVHSVSVHKGVINQVEHLGRSFAAADRSNYNLAKPHDVIYTKSPTGDFPWGVVKQNRLPYNVIVSPLYGVFSPANRHLGYILDAYFESPIRTNNYLAPITQKGAKNTIQISNDTFLSKGLYLPRIEAEQQKIAECLSSVDELIAAQARKVDALKTHKKGLMQQLFPREGETQPRLRFPEFQDPWTKGIIDQLASTVMGNAFKSGDFVQSGIQLIRIGNLYQGELQLGRAPVYLSDLQAEENTKFLVKPSELLMSMTGTVGKRDYGFVVQVPEGCKPLLLNQRVMKIVPKQNCDAGFLLQLLKDERLLDKLYSSPGGTKQANLSAQDVKDLDISYPSQSEQQRIADCLTSLDDLIAAQAQKLEALKTHKKGLMQQLFPSPEDAEA